jgi:chromate reductase, NAD(P)H dehydrogenase (quinone)
MGARMTATPARILLISGSTRAGSSNTLVLQALHEINHPGVVSELYQGLLLLPAFVPDLVPTPGEVDDLLAQIMRADAVVFSTPEYAGGLPGTLKNLLDWTVGGGQLYEKPVAWLDVANVGRGRGALEQLRTVLAYVAARVIEPACVQIGIERVGGSTTLREGATQQLHETLLRLIAATKEANHERASE